MRMPCGTSSFLVSCLSIAMTEVARPEWVYLSPIRSSMPCTEPSSPGEPWSALNTTSGAASASRAATSRPMSMRVTRWPSDFQRVGDARAAGQRHLALGRPAAHQHGDVEGSDGHAGTPTRWISHSSVTPRRGQHARAHFLAQRLDVGRRRAAEVEQEVAMLLGNLRVAAPSARGSRRGRSAPRPFRPAGS